ncbi:MAG: N-6 DNA methylase [Planctomycetes bacterium]|nr:N-6 DNA methylase [Planctomycetota bacterium]
MNFLSLREAAQLLGVSRATVRNWNRAGHIAAAAARPLVFEPSEVFALRERIHSNSFNRLRQRANKSASSHRISPEPFDPAVSAELVKVIDAASAGDQETAGIVYLAALRILESRDEVRLDPSELERGALNLEAAVWRRQPVGEAMSAWRRLIAKPPVFSFRHELERLLERKYSGDLLGLLYQGLSPVGMKSRSGSYFTPSRVIDDSLASFDSAPGSFLDPCCGTGRYLLRAAKRFGLDPERLYGFDSDPIAAMIARINLLLHYPERNFLPKVECLDSLRELVTGGLGCATNRLRGSIDAIATNPPWGCQQNRLEFPPPASLVTSGESFSLFLEKSLSLLRPGGSLSFLLPEAILKIKTHRDIRRIILEQTSIRRISLLGKVFLEVFTPIIRLDLMKNPPPVKWRAVIHASNRVYQAPQSRFTANPDQTFDVGVTPRDEELLGALFGAEHETLHNQADWALGIVTGDNRRLLLDSPAIGTEPVLRGSDIFPYVFRDSRRHIRFAPEAFQQTAPERFYRAPEKLIYRFVSDRLVFAFDSTGLLTLNSANILIPRLSGMSLRAALAFLNSSVFRYIFVKRFGARKILRGDLEHFPFPMTSRKTLEQIEKLVDARLNGDRLAETALDAAVSRCFGLTEAEIKELTRSLLACGGGPAGAMDDQRALNSQKNSTAGSRPLPQGEHHRHHRQ